MTENNPVVEKASERPEAQTGSETPPRLQESPQATPQEKKPDDVGAENPGTPQATPQEKKPEQPQSSDASKPADKSQPDTKQSPSSPTQPEPKTEKPADDQRQKSRAAQLGINMLMFNRWDTSQVTVRDAGLKNHMNLDSMSVPRTGGKYGPGSFQKNKMSIVERFMNRLMVAGHRGKKHKLTSGHNVGKTPRLYNVMKESFVIIEKKTNQNPVQVLVGALENSALLEEVASYRLGGIIARNSVITSPQRRLDLALRHITQGIFRASFRKKKSLANVIADELIAAYKNDPKSFAVSERNRMEKEAEGAR